MLAKNIRNIEYTYVPRIRQECQDAKNAKTSANLPYFNTAYMAAVARIAARPRIATVAERSLWLHILLQ